MSKFRNLLYENYFSFYAKGTPSTCASEMKSLRSCYQLYENQFGFLLNKLPSNACVLDLGCGVGLLLDWLASRNDLRIEGVEHSETMLAMAKNNLPSSVLLCSGDALEFLRDKKNKYHAIFAIDILEHLETDDDVLEFLLMAYQALAPDGFFVLRVPNMANFSSVQLLYKDATHERGFTENSIVQCLEVAGFKNCITYGLKSANIIQRLRCLMETLLHKIIYRICGVAQIKVFSRMLYCAAFKRYATKG